MSEQKNSLGMDEKMASWFAYLLSVVSAIMLLVTEKDNKTVRIHALQSLILGCVFIAVQIILSIIMAIVGWGLGFWLFLSWVNTLLWIAWLVLTVICIIRATQGDIFKLPLIYEQAEKHA